MIENKKRITLSLHDRKESEHNNLTKQVLLRDTTNQDNSRHHIKRNEYLFYSIEDSFIEFISSLLLNQRI